MLETDRPIGRMNELLPYRSCNHIGDQSQWTLYNVQDHCIGYGFLLTRSPGTSDLQTNHQIEQVMARHRRADSVITYSLLPLPDLEHDLCPGRDADVILITITMSGVLAASETCALERWLERSYDAFTSAGVRPAVVTPDILRVIRQPAQPHAWTDQARLEPV